MDLFNKIRQAILEGREQIEDFDDLSEEAKRTANYHFTHHPGDEKSEKRLADLKAKVKGTGKRVVLQGRLGKDNPNAEKYQQASRKAGTYPSGGHPYQRIAKADAKHFDVYTYHREEVEELDEISGSTLGSYIVKSKKDETARKEHGIKVRDELRKATGKNFGTPIDRKLYSPIASRGAGQRMAMKKLTGQAKVNATEEVEDLGEDKRTPQEKVDHAIRDHNYEMMRALSPADRAEKKEDHKAFLSYMKKKHPEVRITEEAEQIDEVGDTPAGKRALGRYIKDRRGTILGAGMGMQQQNTDRSTTDKQRKDLGRRASNAFVGVSRAVDRLTKEEAQQVDELSDEMLKSYSKKALEQSKTSTGDKKLKRQVGARNAIDRLGNNTLAKEEAEELDEVLDTPAARKSYKDKAEKSFKNAMWKHDDKSIRTVVKRLHGLSNPKIDQDDNVNKIIGGKMEEKVQNPYAVGMAAAMKATGDKPPLKKSTIIKGHKIAKGIEAKEEVEDLEEKGLWDNIHAKRERIKRGSGERMRRPGEEGRPTEADFKSAQHEEAKIDEGFTIRSKGYGNVQVVKGGKVIKTFTNPQDARMHIAKINKMLKKD